MSYTLICIDLQESFHSANGSKVQQRCMREINKAIRDKAPIIFVEYAGHGPTLPILTDMVKQARHHKVFHVLKMNDDGSKEVIECLRGKHLPRLNLRVLGVNTSYCVRSTVFGLSNKLTHSTIRVISDACSCWHTSSHRDGLKAMRFMPNTKLLRAPGIA